jgi:hypothetical protein
MSKYTDKYGRFDYGAYRADWIKEQARLSRNIRAIVLRLQRRIK